MTYPVSKKRRLYIQTVKTIKPMMSENDYDLFTKQGYFIIRRTHHFWSGNVTNQIIKQDLMRML